MGSKWCLRIAELSQPDMNRRFLLLSASCGGILLRIGVVDIQLAMLALASRTVVIPRLEPIHLSLVTITACDSQQWGTIPALQLVASGAEDVPYRLGVLRGVVVYSSPEPNSRAVEGEAPSAARFQRLWSAGVSEKLLAYALCAKRLKSRSPSRRPAKAPHLACRSPSLKTAPTTIASHGTPAG